MAACPREVRSVQAHLEALGSASGPVLQPGDADAVAKAAAKAAGLLRAAALSRIRAVHDLRTCRSSPRPPPWGAPTEWRAAGAGPAELCSLCDHWMAGASPWAAVGCIPQSTTGVRPVAAGRPVLVRDAVRGCGAQAAWALRLELRARCGRRLAHGRSAVQSRSCWAVLGAWARLRQLPGRRWRRARFLAVGRAASGERRRCWVGVPMRGRSTWPSVPTVRGGRCVRCGRSRLLPCCWSVTLAPAGRQPMATCALRAGRYSRALSTSPG